MTTKCVYPKCASKSEALSELDKIIHSLHYDELNDGQRTDLQNICISVANYIREIEGVSEMIEPLALLEAWRQHVPDKILGNVWDAEYKIIKQLRNNPNAVREIGIKDGWWKK